MNYTTSNKIRYPFRGKYPAGYLLFFVLFLGFILCVPLSTASQKADIDWKKRHKFAKLYTGVDLLGTFNYGPSSYLDNGSEKSFDRSSFIAPLINIGATHFWGHTDFYVSIFTAPIFWGKDVAKHNTYLGVFTGARLYPWASTENTLRPFVGYKFSPFRYSQESDDGGYTKTRTQSVVDLGLSYQAKNWYLYLGYNRVLNPEIDLYLSRTKKTTTTYATDKINVGVNWMVETTSTTQDKRYRKLNKKYSNTNDEGFFVALGPSSAFPIIPSSYITELHPYLDDKGFPFIFPDLSVGYHATQWDVVTALSFRGYFQNREAFGHKLNVARYGAVWEAYKILFDFQGFSPFIGGGVGLDYITLKEENNGKTFEKSDTKLSPIITFGWDIRPAYKGDWWLLRTNLRYSPTLKLEKDGRNVSFQHLEFNFIQFVLYPQKMMQFFKE